MQDMITEEVTCDGCLGLISGEDFVLTSSKFGLRPMKFAHDGCLLSVKSAFREEGLTVQTRIVDAHFLRRLRRPQ
jgi:hypothetical protein